MSELLDQINTDTNKETISVKEITKALESGFFDAQENITTMIQELDHIDNELERSCVQSLLKVAYTQPLYDKLQQYPELMQRLQVWSQEQYMDNLALDEKQIGGLSLISLPKKSEDVTITTLSKYINIENILPEHYDMLVKILQEQIKLLNQLCPDKKSLLDMTWNSKKNGLDAPVLKIKTLQHLSDRIKKEAQVRKEYEIIKSTSLKQIDPGKLSKDVLKLWTITKLSTLPTELAKLDTESAFAQFLQKNQNDVLYGPILQQYVGIRLQPYIRKEGPVEYVSAAIDTENPELKNYVVGTTFGKKYLGETASAYKNYKEQQQNLAKFHLTGATADQIATFQRKRNNHQARVKPEYLKKIQDEEDRFNHESVMRHSQSTRDSMPYIKKGSVDKYIYDSVVTLTKDYVTLLLQTPEGKKLLKEKKYIDNPFMPGMRLNFAKGNVDSIVRDGFFEKFGDGIDDFKKAWEEGRREEVGRSIGSLVGGTVAAGATTILTGGSGIWAAGAAFTVGSRAGGALGGMIGAGFEGKSWSEVGNAGLVGLGVGERDQNGKFVNYFKDAKGNVTQDSLLHGTGRMGISLGTDYLSSVATFGLGNKIGLDKWAGKFVGVGWKQFASQGVVFGAEELFIENFLVDIPANTLQAGVSSFFLGNAIQDVGPRSAKLVKNTNTDKQIDPNNPTTTQWDIKAALGAMATTFSQNISPENLGQTFAATLAYGGMLSGGRSAINKVAVALPALSVKNINNISTSYQTQLTDIQTKFPTLSIGKDMNTLTLDGKVLDQTHPRFGELEGSLKALQVLGKSFTDEMDKISQIQQGLTDPSSPEAKKRGLIYGWKLLHPRMTPLEVMDGRINKLKKEITTEKNATTKSQKEVLLQQMEKVKGEIEGKVEGTFIMSKSIKLPSGVTMDIQIITEEGIKKWQEIGGMPDIKKGDKIVQLHIDQNADIKKGFQEMKEQLLKLDDNIKYVIGITYLTALGRRYGFDIKKGDKLLEKSSVKVGILDPLNSFFGKFLVSKGMEVNDISLIKEQIKKEGGINNPLYIEFKKYATENGSFSPGGTDTDHVIGEKYVDMRLKYDVKDIGLMIATPSKLLNNDKNNANAVNITPLEKNEQQEAHPANVNNRESVNKALEKLVNLIPTETLRRPNGSIGTQGFTAENLISVARHIAQEMNFTIPDYDKTSSVSEITQLIQYLKNNKEAQQKIKEYVIKDPVIVSLLPDNTYHIEDGNHRANLLNLIGVDVIPTIERNGRKIQDVINEHTAKVEKIEGGTTREVNENSADNSNQKTIETTQNIQPLFTKHPDLLKNIVNPEILQNIIQSEMSAGNLILNTDGSIKEVYTEVGGEKKPSQLFAKMKVEGFSEQQALKTWLQVRTPEFKSRFGDRTSADKSQVSKVVDQNGEPLVVYHGGKQRFSEFKKGLNIEGGSKYGIFTTSNKKAGEGYRDGNYDYNTVEVSNPTLYNLFAVIKSPLSFKNIVELKQYITNITDGGDFKNKAILDKAYEIIKKTYDGIKISETSDDLDLGFPYDQIMIFDQRNIKSAIDNDGSFSPETAKFNDYFGKESRFGFDSRQAIDHSAFMDQFSGQATPEQIAQIRQKIEAVAQMYIDKTGKKLELTDTQIQTIIETHLLPGELGKLTQVELLAKNKKLADTIPDGDLRRFLLEAGFCGTQEDVKPYDLLGISHEKYKEIILEGGGFSEIDKLFEEKFGMKKNIYYFIKKHPEFSEGELRNYINDLKSYELDPLSLSLSYYNNPNEIKKFLMASNMGTSTMNKLFEGGIDFLEIKKLHSLGILEGFNIHDKIIKIKADKHLEDLINNYHKFSKIKELSSIKENYLGDRILLIYEKGYTFDRFQSLLLEIAQLGLDNTQREKIIKIGIDNYRHLQNSGYDVYEINNIIENKFLLDYCVKNSTKLDIMNINKFMYNFSGDQYTDIPKISQFINNAKVSYSLDWMAKIIKENNIDMFVTYKNFNEAKADILQKYIIPIIDKNQITQSDLSISQKKEYVKSKNEFSKDYSLTDIEYNNLFLYDGINKKSELSQGYIGNCRLIAFMNNLRMRNFFESIVRSSIKKVENGYEVTMPLGARDGQKIIVYEDDILNFSTNEQGEKMYRSNTYRSTHKRDGIHFQEFYQQYKKGFTLLEIAFAKYISKSDMADVNAINGSQGTLDQIYDEEDLIDNRFILSQKRIDFSNMKYESLQVMYNILMKFKQGNYIISPHIAHTIEDQKLENSKTSEYLPSGHAYSISDVSIDVKGDMIITVTNPWDTKNLNTKFTLQEFLTFFSSISVSEMNLDQLFDKL